MAARLNQSTKCTHCRTQLASPESLARHQRFNRKCVELQRETKYGTKSTPPQTPYAQNTSMEEETTPPGGLSGNGNEIGIYKGDIPAQSRPMAMNSFGSSSVPSRPSLPSLPSLPTYALNDPLPSNASELYNALFQGFCQHLGKSAGTGSGVIGFLLEEVRNFNNTCYNPESIEKLKSELTVLLNGFQFHLDQVYKGVTLDYIFNPARGAGGANREQTDMLALYKFFHMIYAKHKSYRHRQKWLLKFRMFAPYFCLDRSRLRLKDQERADYLTHASEVFGGEYAELLRQIYLRDNEVSVTTLRNWVDIFHWFSMQFMMIKKIVMWRLMNPIPKAELFFNINKVTEKLNVLNELLGASPQGRMTPQSQQGPTMESTMMSSGSGGTGLSSQFGPSNVAPYQSQFAPSTFTSNVPAGANVSANLPANANVSGNFAR